MDYNRPCGNETKMEFLGNLMRVTIEQPAAFKEVVTTEAAEPEKNNYEKIKEASVNREFYENYQAGIVVDKIIMEAAKDHEQEKAKKAMSRGNEEVVTLQAAELEKTDCEKIEEASVNREFYEKYQAGIVVDKIMMEAANEHEQEKAKKAMSRGNENN